MSNISENHLIEKFTKKSEALSGQRLAVITFKTLKNGTKPHESQCASVPVVTADSLTADVMLAFKPYVLRMVEDTQDKIIREAVEAGRKQVSDDELSVSKVLEFLEEDSKGNRLTKEVITEWFNGSVQDVLMVAIADKLGFSDTPTEGQTKQLEQQMNVYREKFASLAGGKTQFPADVAGKLQKVLEFVPDDAMAVRFNARLEKMKEVPAVDMLGL